jgi:hypothetical protein
MRARIDEPYSLLDVLVSEHRQHRPEYLALHQLALDWRIEHQVRTRLPRGSALLSGLL